MKKEESHKFQQFMAACDRIIFPEQAAEVYILNRRNFRGRNAIAQYFHDPVVYDGHIRFEILRLIPHLIVASIAYFFLIVPIAGYTDSLKRSYRRNFLFVLHLIKLNLRTLKKQCYEINKSHAAFTDSGDMSIAFTVWHEVRHRVQMRRAFKSLLPKEKSELLCITFKYSVEQILRDNLKDSAYAESEYPFEIDANYIAHTMRAYFRREYGEQPTITLEEFVDFTTRNYELMVWENPEINLDT